MPRGQRFWLVAKTTGECETIMGVGLDAEAAADGPRLLKHEQFHVRLACKVAEQAISALKPGASERDMKVAALAADKRQAALQKKYDSAAESNHGCNPAKQAEWEAKVSTGKF